MNRIKDLVIQFCKFGCSKPKPCSGTGTKRNPVEFGLPGGCEYQEAGKPAGDGWK